MRKLATALIILSIVYISMAQQTTPHEALTVLCYNVENLFDTIDDPNTDDADFLPTGANHWTAHRYSLKLERIAQVLSRAGGYHYPVLVGLVEVENEATIRDLVEHTPLRGAGYSYVITQSADPRGIDVALLYRPDIFHLERTSEYNVRFDHQPEKHSRHILLVDGSIAGEPISLMLCHLPSRRGGVRQSEPYRRAVACRMRRIADSLYLSDPKRHLIIMGDFNGLPSEPASAIDLGAKQELPSMYLSSTAERLVLYNLSAQPARFAPSGSYYYRGVWEQIDQFIVSESLFEQGRGLRYRLGSARNYAPRYLGRPPKVAGFLQPWRTYRGKHYTAGYSDHYPIVLELELWQRAREE